MTQPTDSTQKRSNDWTRMKTRKSMYREKQVSEMRGQCLMKAVNNLASYLQNWSKDSTYVQKQ